jgi:hypothetical protein
MKNVKTLLITLALLFLAFVSGCFYLFNVIQKPESPINTETTTPASEDGQQFISLVIDYGDGNSKTYETQATEGTAYELLKMIAIDNNIELDSESYDFGVFVKSLGGYESSSEMAWIYFVNGESGTIASDQYQLKEGDIVEWRFIKPE